MAELKGEEEQAQDLVVDVEDDFIGQYNADDNIYIEEGSNYEAETQHPANRQPSAVSGLDLKDIVEKSQREVHMEEGSEEEYEFSIKTAELNAELDRLTKKLSKISVRRSVDFFLEDFSVEEEDSSIYDEKSGETYHYDVEELMANMSTLPDIDNISLGPVAVVPSYKKPILKHTEKVKEKKISSDKGHFVDPITGGSIHSVMDPDDESEESEVEEEEESISDKSESPIFKVKEDDEIIKLLQEFDEDDILYQLPVTIETAGEQAMATFLEEVHKVPEEEIKESNSGLLRQAAYYERQKKLITEFLNALITRVVNMVEYIDEETMLRKNLDKTKLFDNLIEYICELRAEQRISHFLNVKVVEYYRRKKLYRCLTEGNVDNIREEMHKYQRYLDNLDIVLGYQKHARQNKECVENKLKEKLMELNTMTTSTIQDFENLIRSTFIRAGASFKYVTTINTLIESIKSKREELSDFRRNLIHRQSCIADLLQQLDKVEHLGDGLLFSDFVNQMTEAIKLSKLVDEREHQTGAMRKRFYESLEKVTHMKDNTTMLAARVNTQYEILQANLKEKQHLRKKLHRLKLEHIKVQEETAKVAAQSPLLAKPDVMIDYDVIVERIPIVHERVDKLKVIYAKLADRMDRVVNKCKYRLSTISVK